MHGTVVLEIEFQDVNNGQYTELFVQALKDRFGRELSADQLALLDQAIEKNRLDGQAPVDLAENLAENWSLVFG